MTNIQWDSLKKIISGEILNPMPVGFIVDSPWLPNWYGIKILDYFSNDELWLKANMEVSNKFPDVLFLPGFWSEFGMCTEPSAFGSRCTFPLDEFPHAHKMINHIDDIDSLIIPNPETDGLLPLVLNRLKLAEPKIQDAGHKIRFAVARGPLNIASYLMGSTEFLTAMMMSPDKAHLLISKITTFLRSWIKLQIKSFPSIDGIFLLDDIIGFMSLTDFLTFGLPYFKEIYDEDVSIKFLHNDAPCRESASLLTEIGINLFNMGYDVHLNELKEITNNQITMMGNLPPRDVLAKGSTQEVITKTEELLMSLNDKSRILMSCGGGMPPAVKTKNIEAFISTVQNH